MKCREIIEKLEILSPPSFAALWDNVGLLVGRREKEVDSILLALDITDEVIDEAVLKKVDMLISHHPLIFSSVKKINSDDVTGRRILKLIQNDISYYAMHTNFDVMGMADAVADEIELKHRQVLDITYEDDLSKEGFGRIGRLPRIMSLSECAEFVKEKLAVECVKVFGDFDMMLETAAISPGSGKSMIEPALSAGMDVLITGDINHHEGMDAVAAGMAIIDAGHFGTEKIFVPYMEEYLSRELENVSISVAKQENPFRIL